MTARDFDEIAAQADQNVITDHVANAFRGLETVEKAGPATKHFGILRLREVESESEKLDGLLGLFEVSFVPAVPFFIEIGKELPAKKGLFLAVHDDQVPRHAEKRRRLDHLGVPTQPIPNVEDDVRIEFELRH